MKPIHYLYQYIQMHNQLFIKEWARYRKTGQIRTPIDILQAIPSNPHQLSFLLELATTFYLKITLTPQVLSPLNNKSNINILTDTTIKEIITPEYVRRLLGVHGEMRNQSWSKSKEGRARQILAQVLSHSITTIKQPNYPSSNTTDIDYLKLLGSCYNILQQSIKIQESLKIIKNWWTSKDYISAQISEATFQLLLLWGHLSTNNDMEWLQDTNTLSEKIFTIWFKQIQTQLIYVKSYQQNIISAVQNETKEVCKICKFKTNKTAKEMFKNLKHTFLKNYHGKKLHQMFATSFSVLQITALQSELLPFTFTDLLQYEQLFYSTLFELQKSDKLFLFPSFHAFMRQQSVLSVLQINSTLTLQLQKNKQSIDCQDIFQLIRQKKLSVLQKFKTQPITTATIVVDYFLRDSGIFIKQQKKKVKVGLNHIKMSIIDPLLLLLIKKTYWSDKFGYEVLGLTAWIICQAYCKELIFRIKSSEKVVYEYIKKLKIALCLHLLGLKYPTKMLMYIPEQPEIAWDFVTVPILPALIVQTSYFFKQFLRDQLELRPRTDLSIEGEIMPWSHRLKAQSSIPFILHNYKGYRFFSQILPLIGANFLLPFAETILNSIKIMLQNITGTGISQDPDRRQLNSQLNADRKSDLRTLLTSLIDLCPKIASNAEQILIWLSQP